MLIEEYIPPLYYKEFNELICEMAEKDMLY